MRQLVLGYVDNEIEDLDLFMKKIKKHKGIKLLHTLSFREALGWVRNNLIDHLVSDWKMPIKDGMRLLEESHKINDKISYSILTGFVISEEIEKRSNAIGAHIFFKSDGFDNILSNIEVISTPRASVALTDDQIKLNEVESFLSILTEDLIDSLSCIKNKDNRIIINDRFNGKDESTRSLTVNELISEIKKLTPIGKEYILLWKDTVQTLKKLKKE